MAFDLKTASVLSGLTVHQLRAWSADGTLVPEFNDSRETRYSFRDIIAARSLGLLRKDFSAQAIKKAIRVLRRYNYQDHLAAYRIGHDGRVVLLEEPETGNIMNLSNQEGQYRIFRFGEIWEPYINFKGHQVPALAHPRPGLTVDPDRLGGWPTIGNSRIGYDHIAGLIDGDTITVDDIPYYYPSVSPEQAADALSLFEEVKAA